MATSSENSYTDLTICSICFETFKCPKSLPCLHNFCKSCIESYLESVLQKRQGNIKYATCPICRAEVQKPENVNTSEEWTNDLPTNHMLVSMVDMAKGIPDSKSCDACKLESKTKSAVHWCVECRKTLCELCERRHSYFTQGHKVINMKDINDIDPKRVSGSIKCSKHRDKTIEAYCFDHRVPCCSSCVMITHRKCERVEEAKAAAEELRKSKAFLELQEDFESFQKQMSELSHKASVNVESFKEKAGEIKNQMVTLRSDINSHLESIEMKVKQELTALEKEHLQEIESRVEIFSGETKRAENDVKLVKTSVKYASDEQLLCDIETLTNERDKMKENLEGLRRNSKEKMLKFNPNNKLLNLTDVVRTFGEVSLTEGHMDLESDPIDLLQAVPVKLSEFKGKSSCYIITDCAMINKERLLIGTLGSNSIDMYETNGTLLFSLKLGDFVWGVDMFDDTQGAATLHSAGKLVLFTIYKNSLTPTSTITCPGNGYIFGVKISKERLYIGSEGKVIVLDKNGLFIQKIASLSGEIRHLTFSEDKLVYTNAREVRCVTLRGQDVFNFSSRKLSAPEGIDMDSNRNVYIVGQESRNIVQLTPEGKFHRILLEISSPGHINSLFFCRKRNRLIFNTGRTIHIYDMKNKQSH